MRRALAQPAILFEWFEVADDLDVDVSVFVGDLVALREGAARAQALEMSCWCAPQVGFEGDARAQAPGSPRGVALVTCWAQGEQALSVRASAAQSARWRALAPRLASQPVVHLLAEQGLPWPFEPLQGEPSQGEPFQGEILRGEPWPAEGGLSACALLTVDVEAMVRPLEGGRPARGVVAREALPAIEGGLAWPVIGHPGRLLVRFGQGGDEGAGIAAAARAVEAAWGPLAEPPVVWRPGGGLGDQSIEK